MERLKVLITVKTYPQPSHSYEEIVCTAGVTEDGRLVRLYPVPFRFLSDSQQYAKYQWIEVDATRNPKDWRPESYRPNIESLRPTGQKLGTEMGWAARKDIVLEHLSESVKDLWDKQREHKTSLGVVRPAEVTALTITPCDDEWDPKQLASLRQGKLMGPQITPLPKIPYRFRYRFRCADERCKGHHSMIDDWELGALYAKVNRDCGTDAALSAVRETFHGRLCGPNVDTHFFMGNMKRHPNAWYVLGVFWPPKQDQMQMEF